MKRTLLVLLMLFALVPASPSFTPTASAGSVIVSELTGEEISLGDSGVIVYVPSDYSYEESPPHREEYFGFLTWWSSCIMGFIEGPVTKNELMDVTTTMLETEFEKFEILAQDQGDDHAWFMASLEQDGIELRVYYEHRVDAHDDIDFVFMQYSDEAMITQDFSFVQQKVTVGGDPILQGTDPQRLNDALAGDSGPQTDTSSPGEAPSRTGVDVDGDPDSLLELITQEQTLDEDEPDWEAWAEKGLVSEAEWVSPMYGTSISWDRDIWRVPFEYADAFYSFEDPPYDGFSLVTHDEAGWVSFMIHATGSYLTPQDYLDYWWTPAYAAEFPRGFSIVASSVTTSNVAIVAETADANGQPTLMVMTATFLPDGTVVQSQLYAQPEELLSTYEQFDGSISANGSPLELTWTVQDLQELLGW